LDLPPPSPPKRCAQLTAAALGTLADVESWSATEAKSWEKMRVKTNLEIGYNEISMAYDFFFIQEKHIYIYIYIWLVVWNMAFIFPNSWDDDPI